MVILAILIIVYIMIGYGLFLNTLSEEYIKRMDTDYLVFMDYRALVALWCL